jgi:hypothetical protein
MDKSLRIYVIILLLLLVVIIALDVNKPKPINWEPTYAINDKIPLGLYVLDQELPKLTNQKITKIGTSAYEYLKPHYNYDSLVNNYRFNGTILNISDNKIIDEQSVQEILYFVSHKNNAFFSMKELPKMILDSLKIEVGFDLKVTDSIQHLWLANSAFKNKIFDYREEVAPDYFSKFDTINTTVLGYQSGDTSRVNFIKVNYKSGDVFLHTQPAAFTNFHLLKDNHYEYAEKVLSYIPKSEIHWLTNQKLADNSEKTMLDLIFKNPALKWAWYLFIFGMLVFMIFNAKRKQRIVPIIKPLENTTVDFAKTIGNLYYQEGDHTTIIDKKIIYLLEKIRNEYLIDTAKLDSDFIKKFQQKTGKSHYDIERMVFLINTHRRSPHNSIEDDLININNAIEKISIQ